MDQTTNAVVTTASRSKILLGSGAVALMLVAGFFAMQKPSEPSIAPVSEDGVPLPFNITIPKSSLAGQLTDVGIKNGIPVVDVTLSNTETLQQLTPPLQQGQTHIDKLYFVLTDGTVSAGAPMNLIFSPADALVFCYEYTSKDYIVERTKKAQSEAQATPLPFAERFPGTFMTSLTQRNFDSSITSFETDRGVIFKDLSEVRLKANARYLCVINSDGVTYTGKGISFCGDGILQSAMSEVCDLGYELNGLSTSNCSAQCTAQTPVGGSSSSNSSSSSACICPEGVVNCTCSEEGSTGQGGTTGTSATDGATAGSTDGTNAGGTSGTTSGTTDGTTAGSTSGTSGTTSGTTDGTTAGSTTGTTSGTSGTTSGTSGTTDGTTAGSTSGTTSGTTDGTTAGSTTGTTSGTTDGSTAGSTGGSTGGSSTSSQSSSVASSQSSATAAVCGNGVREGTEQCDDANQNDGDSCRSDCTITGPF